jgi:hypothetical protein
LHGNRDEMLVAKIVDDRGGRLRGLGGHLQGPFDAVAIVERKGETMFGRRPSW